jgi:cytochrome c6
MRKNKLLVLVVFALCSSLLMLSPVAGQAKKSKAGAKSSAKSSAQKKTGGSAALGKKVFNDNCTACHEGGNNTIEADKTLKADALKANGFTGVADVQKRVEEGKGVMPEFRAQLKPAEIKAVAEYVWNTAQSNGWK